MNNLSHTIASIRDELRNHRYTGDFEKQMKMLLNEYDKLNDRYKVLNQERLREYEINYDHS